MCVDIYFSADPFLIPLTDVVSDVAPNQIGDITRAIIIAQGQIVADCRPDELERRSKYHGALTLDFDESVTAEEFLGEFASLEQVALVEFIKDSNQLSLFPRDKDQSILLDVSHLIRDRQLPVVSINQEKGKLDEVFRAVTQEQNP